MAIIQFSHANGVPAESYHHLFQLLHPHQVSYVPAYGLGKYHPRRDWRPLVQELIEAIETTHSEPVVGMGHSLGGVVTCWAALQRPELFSRIILLDPPFLGMAIRKWLIALHPFGLGLMKKISPLAKQALRRRDRFSSYAEAEAYWAQKRFFKSWHPACFDAYVRCALVEDGPAGLTLRIPKELEAQVFATTPHRLRGGQHQMPAHYLHAVPDGVTPPEAIQTTHRKVFPNMGFIPVEGGHMFPVEQPERTADMIMRLIGESVAPS